VGIVQHPLASGANRLPPYLQYISVWTHRPFANEHNRLAAAAADLSRRIGDVHQGERALAIGVKAGLICTAAHMAIDARSEPLEMGAQPANLNTGKSPNQST